MSRRALLAACANLGLQAPGQERPEAPRCGAAQDGAAVTEEGSLVGAPFSPLTQADRGTWASSQGASQSCDLNGTKDGLQGPLVKVLMGNLQAVTRVTPVLLESFRPHPVWSAQVPHPGLAPQAALPSGPGAGRAGWEPQDGA